MSVRKRLSPGVGVRGSGFVSFRRVLCVGSVEDAEKKHSVSAAGSESRVPGLIGKGCKLIGCGSAKPALQVSSDDLAEIVETSDEWISVRTGIRKRRVLSGHESLTSLAVEAAKKTLEMAKVKADDLDLVLMCTSTPEDLFGSAPQIQRALGCKNNPLAYDITAACSGLVLGLVSATCNIGACDAKDDALFAYDSTVMEMAKGKWGSVRSFPPKQSSYSCIQMNGQEVFQFAVHCVPQSIESSLRKAGLTRANIGWLLLHQANQRILDAVATRLEFPQDRVISNLANYGNTSAALIPLALDEAVRSCKVKAGHVLATAGFGACLPWGSVVIRWG